MTTPKISLLIVDDESLVVEMLQRYLETKGYEVRGAGRADEALAVYRAWRPSLVLLDIRLPDGSGLDVLRAIRALDAKARVVVVTALHELDVWEKALEAGASAFAFKPTDVTALDRILRVAGGRGPATGDVDHPAVLIVDDEPEIRLSVKFYLIGRGMQASDAATAEDALALLHSLQPAPQALVLDLDLPKMSGIDCLKQIRQAWPDLPVVVLTGFATVSLREQAEALSVQRFLRKPVALQALEQAIREVLPHA